MEHDENTLGTHWEHGRKQKLALPPTSPKKKKNWTLEECMLSLLIGCMKLLFPKLFCHQFWPGLIAKGHKL